MDIIYRAIFHSLLECRYWEAVMLVYLIFVRLKKCQAITANGSPHFSSPPSYYNLDICHTILADFQICFLISAEKEWSGGKGGIDKGDEYEEGKGQGPTGTQYPPTIRHFFQNPT